MADQQQPLIDITIDQQGADPFASVTIDPTLDQAGIPAFEEAPVIDLTADDKGEAFLPEESRVLEALKSNITLANPFNNAEPTDQQREAGKYLSDWLVDGLKRFTTMAMSTTARAVREGGNLLTNAAPVYIPEEQKKVMDADIRDVASQAAEFWENAGEGKELAGVLAKDPRFNDNFTTKVVEQMGQFVPMANPAGLYIGFTSSLDEVSNKVYRDAIAAGLPEDEARARQTEAEVFYSPFALVDAVVDKFTVGMGGGAARAGVGSLSAQLARVGKHFLFAGTAEAGTEGLQNVAGDVIEEVVLPEGQTKPWSAVFADAKEAALLAGATGGLVGGTTATVEEVSSSAQRGFRYAAVKQSRAQRQAYVAAAESDTPPTVAPPQDQLSSLPFRVLGNENVTEANQAEVAVATDDQIKGMTDSDLAWAKVAAAKAPTSPVNEMINAEVEKRKNDPDFEASFTQKVADAQAITVKTQENFVKMAQPELKAKAAADEAANIVQAKSGGTTPQTAQATAEEVFEETLQAELEAEQTRLAQYDSTPTEELPALAAQARRTNQPELAEYLDILHEQKTQESAGEEGQAAPGVEEANAPVLGASEPNSPTQSTSALVEEALVAEPDLTPEQETSVAALEPELAAALPVLKALGGGRVTFINDDNLAAIFRGDAFNEKREANTLEVNLAKLGSLATPEAIRATLNHEVWHFAQGEAIRNAWEATDQTQSFEEFRTAELSRVRDDVDALAKAEGIENPAEFFGKVYNNLEGTPTVEQTLEFVRLLQEYRESGKISETLWSDISSRIREWIDTVLAGLRGIESRLGEAPALKAAIEAAENLKAQAEGKTTPALEPEVVPENQPLVERKSTIPAEAAARAQEIELAINSQKDYNPEPNQKPGRKLEDISLTPEEERTLEDQQSMIDKVIDGYMKKFTGADRSAVEATVYRSAAQTIQGYDGETGTLEGAISTFANKRLRQLQSTQYRQIKNLRSRLDKNGYTVVDENTDPEILEENGLSTEEVHEGLIEQEGLGYIPFDSADFQRLPVRVQELYSRYRAATGISEISTEAEQGEGSTVGELIPAEGLSASEQADSSEVLAAADRLRSNISLPQQAALDLALNRAGYIDLNELRGKMLEYQEAGVTAEQIREAALSFEEIFNQKVLNETSGVRQITGAAEERVKQGAAREFRGEESPVAEGEFTEARSGTAFTPAALSTKGLGQIYSKREAEAFVNLYRFDEGLPGALKQLSRVAKTSAGRELAARLSEHKLVQPVQLKARQAPSQRWAGQYHPPFNRGRKPGPLDPLFVKEMGDGRWAVQDIRGDDLEDEGTTYSSRDEALEILHKRTDEVLAEQQAGDPALIEVNFGVAHLGGIQNTILHEAVHAVTYDIIQEYRNGVNLDPNSPVYTLNILFNEAMEKLGVDQGEIAGNRTGTRNFYGMTNLHEFATEALVNPKFQQWLQSWKPADSSIFGSAKTAWDAFVNALKGMLGIEGHRGSALDGALRAVIQIIDSPRVHSVEDVRGEPVQSPSLLQRLSSRATFRYADDPITGRATAIAPRRPGETPTNEGTPINGSDFPANVRREASIAAGAASRAYGIIRDGNTSAHFTTSSQELVDLVTGNEVPADPALANEIDILRREIPIVSADEIVALPHLDQGSESDVYLDADAGAIYKVSPIDNGLVGYGYTPGRVSTTEIGNLLVVNDPNTFDKYLERIAVDNLQGAPVFSEIVGITDDARLITKQPYVLGLKAVGELEIPGLLGQRGVKFIGGVNNAAVAPYGKTGVVYADLHGENVMKDSRGVAYIVDAPSRVLTREEIDFNPKLGEALTEAARIRPAATVPSDTEAKRTTSLEKSVATFSPRVRELITGKRYSPGNNKEDFAWASEVFKSLEGQGFTGLAQLDRALALSNTPESLTEPTVPRRIALSVVAIEQAKAAERQLVEDTLKTGKLNTPLAEALAQFQVDAFEKVQLGFSRSGQVLQLAKATANLLSGQAFNYTFKKKATETQVKGVGKKVAKQMSDIVSKMAKENGKVLADAGVQAAIARAAVKVGDPTLADLVSNHYTQVQDSTATLTQKISSKYGITKFDAAKVSLGIETAIRAANAKAQESLLVASLAPLDKDVAAKILASRRDIVDLAVDGMLNDETFYNVVAKSFGLPAYTPAIATEITRQSNEIEKMPLGKARDLALHELHNYMAREVGVDWFDVAEGWWYSAVLSGVGTQATNIIAGVTRLTSEQAITALLEPKATGKIAQGIWSGFFRGVDEAIAAFDRGDFSGQVAFEAGRAARPLELVRNVRDANQVATEEGLRPGTDKFKERVAQILKENSAGKRFASYGKYVSRFMAAMDLINYTMGKEARARLLAYNAVKDQPLSSTQMEEAYAKLLGLAPGMAQAAQRQALTEGFVPPTMKSIENYLKPTYVFERLKFRLGRLAGTRTSERGFNRRVAEILEEQRDATIVEKSNTYALEVTYNKKPEGALGWFSDTLENAFRAKAEEAKAVSHARRVLKIATVPFSRIVANVGNDWLNYTPVGIVRWGVQKYTGDDSWYSSGKEPTTEDRDLFRAKVMLGNSIFMALAVALTYRDKKDEEKTIDITGAGPRDFDENKQWREKNKPWSIKVGDTYISYATSPLCLALGALGTYRDAMVYEDGKLTNSTWAKMITLLRGSQSAMQEQTFIKTVSSLLKLVGDTMATNETFVDRFTKYLVGIPEGVYPNLLKETEAWVDGHVPEIDGGAGDYILRDTPIARSILAKQQPVKNALGEDVVIKRWPWDRFVKVDDKSDPIWAELKKRQEQKVFVRVPQRADLYEDEEGKLSPMSKSEYNAFRNRVGQLTREQLVQDLEEFKTYTAAEADAYLKAIYQGFSEQARGELQEQRFQKQTETSSPTPSK